jgi:hypothetical protein
LEFALQVPDTILAHKDKLMDMYKKYVDDFFNILGTVHGLRTNKKWITSIRALKETVRLLHAAWDHSLISCFFFSWQPLEDGLMIPLQRMPVYELLLRKLSASTSSDHAVR